MMQLFHSFIFQPIYNILILLYNFLPGHDLGVAIIVLTVFIRLILYPIAKKQIESQKKMQELSRRSRNSKINIRATRKSRDGR